MHHPITGIENLHRHSDNSLLDGLGMVKEYAKYSAEVNQKYLCITDHGVMGAVPAQIEQAEKNHLFPIFGCELYINELQPESSCREESQAFRKDLPESQQKIFDKSSHLLGIAYTDQGYSNLVRLSSWAWRHGYYKRPRINHKVLEQYKEGIIFTSTCAASEIARTFFEHGEDAGMDMVAKYRTMFGENFYLELMMLDFKLQKPYDAFLIRAHKKYNIPMILTTDCHYCRREHSKYQRLMLMMQTERTVQELEAIIRSDEGADLFELQDTNLWMKSEAEFNEMWETTEYRDIIDYEIFKQAKANTVKICEMAKGVQLDRTIKLPSMEAEEKILWELTMKGFSERALPDTEEYHRRLKGEYDLICKKGFASYFLIQNMLTQAAMDKVQELYGWEDRSMARGPGRGSACGSILAYCLDLHDLDSIEHDLLFDRFLSPARGGIQMKTRFTSKPIIPATAEH
jgi:DNA polymerase-3 subunit alpha